MKPFVNVRQLAAALTLAGGVLVLCSARPPLSMHHNTHRERPGARALRAFEQHQLALRDSIVRLALAQVGTPYEFGGTTPEGFDCSGLIRYVYSQLYLTPPRTAARQARIGRPIRRDDGLRPGDILAFGPTDTVTHVGIYVGDRKFVHASSVAGRVIVSSVDRPPHELIQPLKSGRRILAMAN